MNKTTIQWVKNPDGTQGYTWNPITGCLNHVNGLCKGGGFPCYAYKLAHGRLRKLYQQKGYISTKALAAGEYAYYHSDCDPFYPRFWPERLFELNPISRTSKGIFVCDMSDLFGIGIPEEWTQKVLESIRKCPQHRFYLLTKQPQNLPKWSPFPPNCYVGVTATNPDMLKVALDYLNRITATIKYASLEPLLAWNWDGRVDKLPVAFRDINWLIIGACTGTKTEMSELAKMRRLEIMPYGNKWTAQPKIEWVQEIVEAADRAGVKVFLKNNLEPLIDANSPDENELVPNHDSRFRMEHPYFCKECREKLCHACGVIWGLRQELPK